jgi:hypothetical protein
LRWWLWGGDRVEAKFGGALGAAEEEVLAPDGQEVASAADTLEGDEGGEGERGEVEGEEMAGGGEGQEGRLEGAQGGEVSDGEGGWEEGGEV